MKVLIGTITSEHKDYCFKEWINNLKQLTFSDTQLMIVDNSRNPEYHKKIARFVPEGSIVVWHPIQANQSIRECMCKCDNLLRDYLLKKEFDFLFNLESDVFPRMDAIEQLYSHKKLIVGFPYFYWQGCHSKLLNQYIGGYGEDKLVKPFNLDEAFMFMDGTLKEGFNYGIGCMLIHSSVFKKIKFRVDLDTVKHVDSFFHEDLYKNGIQAYLDTSYVPIHKNFSNWNEIFKKEKQ